MNIFMLIALFSLMDVDTADTILDTKDMSRAQRRHNTQVAINRKKTKKTCRKGSGNWCPQPWWNTLDENGKCEKPALGKNKSGNIQHKGQQHRWDTYVYSSKKNTWKKTYDSRDIEAIRKFDKIDARAEREDILTDEQIEALWDEYTGEPERKINEKKKLLQQNIDEATDQLRDIESKYEDVLHEYFALKDHINDLQEQLYWID